MKRVINDSQKWFASMGGLHDSRIDSFEWQIGTRTLVVKVNDLFANFRDTDQDVGSLPASLSFLAVSSLEMTVDPFTDMLRIYDVESHVARGRTVIRLRLAPGGCIQVEFYHVELDTQMLPSAAMMSLLGS